MNASLRHNGCDTLMLGFDYELRRRGFAGNSCQIMLELAAAIDPPRLEQRVSELIRQHPVLSSRPARFGKPRWKPGRAGTPVRWHREPGPTPESLFNEPLDVARGELIRFDLAGKVLLFTWSHALMDAKSAEYFVALAGNEQLRVPEPGEDWYAGRATSAGGIRDRMRCAWRALERLEQFKGALPVSLGVRRPPTAGNIKYKIVALSAEDSARVKENSARVCGFLGDTNFHLAATLVELHLLHQRTGVAGCSYVVPIPVGLRPKGMRAPLFSNQVTMLLHQFLPGEVETVAAAASSIKSQRAECVRNGDIDASITLAHLFRALPLRAYMWLIKHELRGEICSLFFGDTSTVDPALETMCGAEITAFAHVPAVTVPPGIGLVFYRFRNRLHFTLFHAEGTLTAGEADDFASRVLRRLLNP